MDSSDAPGDGNHVPAHASPEVPEPMNPAITNASNSLRDSEVNEVQVSAPGVRNGAQDDSKPPLLPAAVNTAESRQSVDGLPDNQAKKRFDGIEIPDSDDVSPPSSWDQSGDVQIEGELPQVCHKQIGAVGNGVKSGSAQFIGSRAPKENVEKAGTVDGADVVSGVSENSNEKMPEVQESATEVFDGRVVASGALPTGIWPLDGSAGQIESRPLLFENSRVDDTASHITESSDIERHEVLSSGIKFVDDKDVAAAEPIPEKAGIPADPSLSNPSPLNLDSKALLVAESFPTLDDSLISPTPEASAPLSSLVNPNPLFEEAFACIDAAKNNSINSSNPFLPPETVETTPESPSAADEMDEDKLDTPSICGDMELSSTASASPMEFVTCLEPASAANGEAASTGVVSSIEGSQIVKKTIPHKIPASDDDDDVEKITDSLPNVVDNHVIDEVLPDMSNSLATNIETIKQEEVPSPVDSVAMVENGTAVPVSSPPPPEPVEIEISNASPLSTDTSVLEVATSDMAQNPDLKLSTTTSTAMEIDLGPASLVNKCGAEPAESVQPLGNLQNVGSMVEGVQGTKATHIGPDGETSHYENANSQMETTATELLTTSMEPPKKKTKTDHSIEQEPQEPSSAAQLDTEPKLEPKSKPKSKPKAQAKKRGRTRSRTKSKEEPAPSIEAIQEMEFRKGPEIEPRPVEAENSLETKQPNQEPLLAQDSDASTAVPDLPNEEVMAAADTTTPARGKGCSKRKGSSLFSTTQTDAKETVEETVPESIAVKPNVPSKAADQIQTKRKLESTSLEANSPLKAPEVEEDGDVLFAELKAMKISSIQGRNTSLEAEIAEKRIELSEVTKELQFPAAETVKRHIKLLHDYNDIRDVGQGLIGMIADNRGVRIGELYEEFGVGLKD